MSAKTIGVVFCQDLKSSLHCKEALFVVQPYAGVNQQYKYRNPESLINLYKSLVIGPHLNYCSTVWNPQYKKDNLLLERP